MDVIYATLPAHRLPRAESRRSGAVGRLTSRLARGRSPLADLARAARRSPDHVQATDDGRAVTADELFCRVRLLAGVLHARGIATGSTVGVLCDDHSGLTQAMLAAEWVGARVVPVEIGATAEQLGEVGRREQLHLLVHDAAVSATVVASGLDVVTLISDGHGSGSVSGACDFAHPAPPRRRRR